MTADSNNEITLGVGSNSHDVFDIKSVGLELSSRNCERGKIVNAESAVLAREHHHMFETAECG